MSSCFGGAVMRRVRGVLASVPLFLVAAIPALAEAPDLTAYTGVVEDLTGAIGTAAPVIIGSVVAIAGGFLAVRVGLRFLRQNVK